MWEYFLWSFKLFISVLNYLFQSPINYFLFLFFLIRFLSFTFYPFFLQTFFLFFHLILFLFLLLFLITKHIIRSYYLFWFSFHFKLNQIFIQFVDNLLLFISFALCSLYISTPFVYFLIWLVLILCWSLLYQNKIVHFFKINFYKNNSYHLNFDFLIFCNHYLLQSRNFNFFTNFLNSLKKLPKFQHL